MFRYQLIIFFFSLKKYSYITAAEKYFDRGNFILALNHYHPTLYPAEYMKNDLEELANTLNNTKKKQKVKISWWDKETTREVVEEVWEIVRKWGWESGGFVVLGYIIWLCERGAFLEGFVGEVIVFFFFFLNFLHSFLIYLLFFSFLS